MDKNTPSDAISTADNYALNGKIMLCSVLILFSVVSAVIFFHAFSRCRRHVISGILRRSGPKGGLDPALLAALPTFHHSSDGSAPPECAVCLSEFEPGHELRALPRCRHAFHVACIDAWFGSRSDCPLCRSPVAPAPRPGPEEVRIAVSEPRDETGCSPAERCERKTRLDLAGLAEVGLGSPQRNRVRVKCSLKRIWSI